MEQLIPIVNKLQDVFNTIGQNRSGIDLPQIVVVGSQSSGKSSVLESLVGRGFLPRGSGICTRRPLVLQLFNTSGTADGTPNYSSPHKQQAQKEWAEFLHLPNKRFHDFDKVRSEILRETERLAGNNSGISNQAIRLKIFSPNVLTLTLVDLPGITRVPIGDQPGDIELQTRNLCLEFCKNPNAIILAVTAANTDLANSDSIKLAQEVDPEGIRTLGVLTKIDLMDDGTDAVDMLSGNIIPLRKGYIGVVNRSQAEIKSGLDVRESIRKENTFFLNHPSYRHFADRMGSQYLAKTLNSMLLRHIRECIPEIKTRVNQQLHEVEANISALGKSPVSGQGKTEKSGLLLRLISQFAAEFTKAIDGSGDNIELHELRGGARIGYIFNTIFAQAMDEISPFEGLEDGDIRTAINNATGAKTSLFVPEMSFELLVKHQILQLEKPSQQCVELVYDELQNVAAQCETKELSRFVVLRDRILEAVNDLLRKNLSPALDMVANLIQIELAYINTSHPDFIGGSRAVSELLGDMSIDDGASTTSSRTQRVTGITGPLGKGRMSAPPPPGNMESDSKKSATVQGNGTTNNDATAHGNNFLSFILAGNNDAPRTSTPPPYHRGVATDSTHQEQQPSRPAQPSGNLAAVPTSVRSKDMKVTERQKVEIEIIKSLMRSYLTITKNHVQDLVPKTIMYFLVNQSRNHIQSELVSRLYREDQIDELLQEDEHVSERRKDCLKFQSALKNALIVLHEVRDFKVGQDQYPVYE